MEQIQTVDREIQKLEGEKIEADVLRANLNRFGELFQKLKPEEQRELIRLFVREIHFDGINKRIKMEIRVLPEPLPDFPFEKSEESLGSHSVQQSSPYWTNFATGSGRNCRL